MSQILLQLEAALADARSAQERAAERLHDTGVAHALAKSQYDAAADAVKRVEGALNSMHGVAVTVLGSGPTIDKAAAPLKDRKPREPRVEGPTCPSCGTPNKLSIVMRGQMKFAHCGECNAETQAA